MIEFWLWNFIDILDVLYTLTESKMLVAFLTRFSSIQCTDPLQFKSSFVKIKPPSVEKNIIGTKLCQINHNAFNNLSQIYFIDMVFYVGTFQLNFTTVVVK